VPGVKRWKKYYFFGEYIYDQKKRKKMIVDIMNKKIEDLVENFEFY